MIYEQILNKRKDGIKQFAVLIDPDKVNSETIESLCRDAVDCSVDYIFVG